MTTRAQGPLPESSPLLKALKERSEKRKEAESKPSPIPIDLPDPAQKPKVKGETGGPCPECGGQTVARQQRGTHRLYFGCENYIKGCGFNGCRDIPETPGTQI